MAETSKTLAPLEPASPTLVEQAASSAATQTATPVRERASTQRVSQRRSMTHGQGGQVQYFEELQRAAGNRAVSRMMTQRAAQAETQRESAAATGVTEEVPLTPRARAQAEETAVEQAETAARSDEPEFAQSVDVRPSSGMGESTPELAETEAEMATPPAEASVPRGETGAEVTEEQTEVEGAVEDLEQTAEQVETEEGETGEEAAEAVESEQQEDAVAPVSGAGGGGGEIQAAVDTAVARLARPMAETAVIGSQAVRFAPRAEEKSTNPRVARQGAQKRSASEAVIADFVARNVHHAANLSAYGMTAAPQIMAAAAVAKANIDVAVAASVAAITAQIAAVQGQVIAQAAAANAIITAQSVLATAVIQAATIQAKADIEKACADTKSALDTKETDQLTAAGDLYTTWKPKYESTGTEIGDEALGIARQKANNWLSQRNGESTLLDGPIHDNRLEARSDAAIKVAKEYKKGLQKCAKEQADKVTEGKPAVLDAVRQKAEEARTNLEAHRQGLIDALTGAETAAIGQITGIATSLIAGVDAGQAASLASLATQQAMQVAQLFDYGNSQKTAIDEQAAQAVVALLAGTGEAVTVYNEALMALVTDALGSEAPDAAELTPILVQAQIQADMLAMNALLQLELGIQKSVEGVNNGGVQSSEAVNQLGQSAAAQAAGTGTEFTVRTASMVAQAIQGFAQLQEGCTKTVDETKTNAIEGFEQAKTGLEETFTAISTNVKNSLSNGRTELKNALRREGLKDLGKTIQEQADKAADAVQPRWKKVLKALITIVVVIAVIALAIVTAGAGGVLGGILIGAALGGLAGATIQVGHNLVDGKKWSDGVGKAFVVGAIGGAFGGIGGALAKGVANVGLKFGLEAGVDVIGGIVGDLAVGNPITVEGVLMGAAIGAGVGGGLALGSALKGKIKIRPSIEMPTPGVRPGIEAPAPRAGAPEVAAPPASRAAPREATPAPAPKTKPVEAPSTLAPKAKAPEAPTAPTTKTTASEAPFTQPPKAKAPETTAVPTSKPPVPEAPAGPFAKTQAPEPPASAKAPTPEAAAPKATPPEPTAPKRKGHPDHPEIEEGVVAKHPTADGHQMKVTQDGSLVRCTVCEPLRLKYAKELGDDPALRKRLDAIEALDDPKLKAKRAAELYDELNLKKTVGQPKNDPLVGSDGKFADTGLEDQYRSYLERKLKRGQTPRDRSDWKTARDYWMTDSPMARGNKFNETAGRNYPYNEVHLGNGKRVDSYVPPKGKKPGEIISRKATDFDDIQPETFKSYLSELKKKYAPDTPINSAKYRETFPQGSTLEGKQILEVPDSNLQSANRAEFEKVAKGMGIEIRYTLE